MYPYGNQDFRILYVGPMRGDKRMHMKRKQKNGFTARMELIAFLGVLALYVKGARYLLIIHEVLVAMGFFPAGVQNETLKEESQRLASNSCHNNDFNLTLV